jgi:hypothetical protein
MSFMRDALSTRMKLSKPYNTVHKRWHRDHPGQGTGSRKGVGGERWRVREAEGGRSKLLVARSKRCHGRGSAVVNSEMLRVCSRSLMLISN